MLSGPNLRFLRCLYSALRKVYKSRGEVLEGLGCDVRSRKLINLGRQAAYGLQMLSEG